VAPLAFGAAGERWDYPLNVIPRVFRGETSRIFRNCMANAKFTGVSGNVDVVLATALFSTIESHEHS
jgi:hypothetical protein